MKKLIIITLAVAIAGLLTFVVQGGGPVATQPRMLEDGRIVIDRPTTITEPGSYVVTRSISSATGSVITIETGGITLDLNGFTVAGGIGGFGWPGKIEIRNGTIRGGGIWLNGKVYVHGISFVDFDGRCLFVEGGTSIVENNTFHGCGVGIWLDDAAATIVHNNALDEIGGTGITIESGSGSRVSSNVIRHADVGIDLSSDDLIVQGNTVAECSGDGIVAPSSYNSIIAANNTSENLGIGIRITGDSRGNILRGNLSRENGGDGCTNPQGTADFCDEGTNNTSHGDNYMPGKM